MQNKNTSLIIALVVIVIAIIVTVMVTKKNTSPAVQEPMTSAPTSTAPYTYKNHGVTFNLPGYTLPAEQKLKDGKIYLITLPGGTLRYVTNATVWEQDVLSEMTYVKAQAIGVNVYEVYSLDGKTFYWMKQGNVGYYYTGDSASLQTMKFVGWAQ